MYKRQNVHRGLHKLSEEATTNYEGARLKISKFINCSEKEIVFTSGATAAINLVAYSWGLKNISAGDEIIITIAEHHANIVPWQLIAQQKGAKIIAAQVNPKEDFDAEIIKKLVTNKTKIIAFPHVSNVLGTVFPVKEICEQAKKRGLITIVDGAHVPGHIDLDLSAIQADFYTGACHKWMMTPKGCSFLYANPNLQHLLDPLIISWGYESDNPSASHFFDYHQYNGTRDFSAFLTLPKAVEFRDKHNWKSVSDQRKATLLAHVPKLFD